MRYHAWSSWCGVAFPPATRTIRSRCRAGIVGHRFGTFGVYFRLRRPMVIVIWRDGYAPLEWNRQTAEHAGLTSNCRHRVIRQRRTERQKHACPLPQPIRAFGRCGESNSHQPVHIVRQTAENMRELPAFTFVEHMLNGARRRLRPRDHSPPAPSPAWTTRGVRRLIRSFVRWVADPKPVHAQRFRDVVEGRLRRGDDVVPGVAVVGSRPVLPVNEWTAAGFY